MTLTTERLKWLHDAATELSATKLKMTMKPDELLVLTSELLANREAQPVALDVIARFKEWNTGFPVEKFKADYVIGWMLANYYAPPAPAVPEAIITAPIEAMRCGPAASYVLGWNAYRAAMLESIDKPAPQLDSVVTLHADQPVSSGYKLITVDFLTTASRLIDICRTHAILNDGDYKQRTINECENTMKVIDDLLAAAPEGGNG